MRGPGLIEALAQKVAEHVPAGLTRLPSLPDELAYEVEPDALLTVARTFKSAPGIELQQLVDAAGVDYLHHGREEWETQSATHSGFSRGRMRAAAPDPDMPRRFGVSYQLLSIKHNHRVRLAVRCPDTTEPAVDSLVGIWPSADWFEREAFDLFGIIFRGHPDLRRILTDYGFIGHPFRKDFPLIGNVEVQYDPERQRVVYQPVSIVPRVLVPKVIRHDNRYEPALRDVPGAPGPR
jgi:NADH-quinone oxidoreductase subunit C